jgi:hypothetical protein
MALLGLALFALAPACGHPHLTASFGRASHEAFTRQVVNPAGKSEGRAVNGLDSQEAALVTAAYRRVSSPRGAATRDQSMILLSPSAEASTGSSYVAPASVPAAK